MNVKEFLNEVAYVDTMDFGIEISQVYKSKFDNSYITHVGLENDVKYLAEKEITQELTHGVGFSPKDGKWYGWSHRAIYGFDIGSTCKKGDCHYRVANEDDEIEAALRFWSDDEYHEKTWVEKVENGEIHINWKYNNTVPNEKIRNTISGVIWHFDPNNFGKGEWIAETLEDAKQMAIDFNKGVS